MYDLKVWLDMFFDFSLNFIILGKFKDYKD